MYAQGAELGNVIIPRGFRIHKRDNSKRNVITTISDEQMTCADKCPIHGASCLGHELCIRGVDIPQFSPVRPDKQSELAM